MRTSLQVVVAHRTLDLQPYLIWMYTVCHVAPVVSCCFSHLAPLWTTLKETVPAAQKERTSRCCPRSLGQHLCRYAQTPPLPAGYVHKVQKWRSGAEVTQPVHFTESPHNLTTDMVTHNQSQRWFIIRERYDMITHLGELRPFSHLCATLLQHRSCKWRRWCICIEEESNPTPFNQVKWASHEDTYRGHLSKLLNCAKPVFAVQTVMCSFVHFGRPKKSSPTFSLGSSFSVTY